MHLRLPAFDRGITSFLWAFFFGLFIWIGGIAVGFGSAVTFIVGAVAGFLIFLSDSPLRRRRAAHALRAGEREHEHTRQVVAELVHETRVGARSRVVDQRAVLEQ